MLIFTSNHERACHYIGATLVMLLAGIFICFIMMYMEMQTLKQQLEESLIDLIVVSQEFEAYRNEKEKEVELLTHNIEEQNLALELFETDMDIFARVVYAEAGGEPEMAIRLVIDTILNRVDDPRFSDSIIDVCYAPGQFTVVESGAIWCNDPQQFILDLIYEEMECRTNTEVLYFRAGYYFDWAEPICCIGNSYFSK